MKRLLTGIALFGICLNAQAWSATAYTDANEVWTVYNALSPDAAKEEALERCREKYHDRVCKVFKPIRATAVAIVKGTNIPLIMSGDSIYQVADPDPDLAVKQGMADCKVKKKYCWLDSIVWDKGNTYAAVAGVDGVVKHITLNSTTLAEAEKEALDKCRNVTNNDDRCKILLKTYLHAWFVQASSTNYNDGQAFGISTESKQVAVDMALKTCRESASDAASCKVVQFYENLGPTLAPASVAKLEKSIKPEVEKIIDNMIKELKKDVVNQSQNEKISSDGSCRPRTETIRCKSRCTNGDCEVEYENGCKIRVKVQPKFDSIQNQWTYPSPSC
jgi:hypothetical protein